VVVGTVVVVGSKNVVVVGGSVVEVVEGADVGGTVEVVVVGAELDCADAAEFLATAEGPLIGALEQAAVPRPKTTRAETAATLVLRM
jgi:hypothetical protein